MKAHFKSIVAMAAAFVSVVLISSCEKDEGKLPNIDFISTAGYTSASTTVSQNDTLQIGIAASKSEDKDVLKTFDVSVSYDGGTATSLYNTNLSGADGDNYSYTRQVITRAQAGTEKYTFTVVNRDGITNSKSLTLTVN